MNEIRIRENLELQKLYSVPNPKPRKPLVPRRLKFEREQARLDADKKAWFNAMVSGMWTTGK